MKTEKSIIRMPGWLVLGLIFFAGCSPKIRSAINRSLDSHSAVSTATPTPIPTPSAELDSTWAPQWNKVIGLWHFNESAAGSFVTGDTFNDYADSSGLNHHLKQFTTTFGATGMLLQAANFSNINASGTQTQPFAAVEPYTTAFTIQAWVYSRSLQPSSQMILLKGADVMSLYLKANTNEICTYVASGGTGEVCSGYVMPLNQWTHLTLVLAGNAKFYVNGVLIATKTSDFPSDYSSAVGLGWNHGNNLNHFDGIIDEAAIWKTGLTAGEITTIYSRELAGFSTTRTAPSLAWAPNVWDYGTKPVGDFYQYANHTFTLSNTGNAQATGCSAPVLTNSTDFAIVSDGCGTSSLAPSGTCDVIVQVRVASHGAKSTTLSRTCSVGGTQMTLSDQIVVYATEAVLTWTQAGNAFGNVSVGSSSADFDFTLTNTGDAGATGCTSPALDDSVNFTIVTENCSGAGNMNAGFSCIVRVHANPTTLGAHATTLRRTCSLTGGTGSTSTNGITVTGVP